MPASDNYAQEREILDEGNALFWGYTDTPLLYRRELKRIWPIERDDIIADCLEYLEEHAYVNPADTPPFPTRYSVPGPAAGRRGSDDAEWPGAGSSEVWRVVSNQQLSTTNESEADRGQAPTGILQTLRWGFAQALNWDEARVIDHNMFPGNDASDPIGTQSNVSGVNNTESDKYEEFLVVEFVNLDPAYVRAAINNLYADASYHPAVGGAWPIANTDGKAGISFVASAGDRWERDELGWYTSTTAAYLGFWHLIGAQVVESSLTDGSCVVRVTLARPQYTLNAYKTYVSWINGAQRTEDVHYLWNVPKDIAQDILDDFKTASGRSATASYSQDDNLVNLVLGEITYSAPYLYYADTTAGLSCSEVVTRYYYWGVRDPADVDPTSLTGWGLAGYTFSGSLNFDDNTGLVDIVITSRMTVARTYGTFDVQSDHFNLVQRYIQDGVDEADIYDIYPDALPPQGTEMRQSIRLRDDCTFNVDTDYIYSYEKALYFHWPSNGGAGYAFVYQNWRDYSEIQTLVSTFPPVFNTSITSQFNSDNTYDALLRTEPTRTSGGGGGAIAGSDFYFGDFTFERRSTHANGLVSLLVEYGALREVTYHGTETAAHNEMELGFDASISWSSAANAYRVEKTVAYRQGSGFDPVIGITSKTYPGAAGVAFSSTIFPGVLPV